MFFLKKLFRDYEVRFHEIAQKCSAFFEQIVRKLEKLQMSAVNLSVLAYLWSRPVASMTVISLFSFLRFTIGLCCWCFQSPSPCLVQCLS